MEYLFILGRNYNLSKAEILSHFKARNISYRIINQDSIFLILEVDDSIEFNIQNFGGILKIGEIKKINSKKEISDWVENYFAPISKFRYSVISNSSQDYIEYIEDLLKVKFKKEKLKAQVKHSYDKIKIQDGESIDIVNSDLEFLFFKKDESMYIGVVDQKYSYEEVKMRDMKKPVRREALAISPRLAKILINLSQVKEGETLLDPFCGIGGIIQEALIEGINIIGSDIDKEAINGAKKNINWLSEIYEINSSYKLFNIDSSKLHNIKIDGVATESSLGELLKKKQGDENAKSFIKKFENNIIPVLKKLKEIKKDNSKIAISFPFIRNISADLELIQNKTGLKIYKLDDIAFPIKEVRKDQFVGREIMVFE